MVDSFSKGPEERRELGETVGLLADEVRVIGSREAIPDPAERNPHLTTAPSLASCWRISAAVAELCQQLCQGFSPSCSRKWSVLPDGDYMVTTKKVGKAVWSETELMIHKC